MLFNLQKLLKYLLLFSLYTKRDTSSNFIVDTHSHIVKKCLLRRLTHQIMTLTTPEVKVKPGTCSLGNDLTLIFNFSRHLLKLFQ